MKIILTFLLLLIFNNTYANLKTSFEAIINQPHKGPYDCNSRQTDIGRYCYINGNFPGLQGEHYFDAAFRTPEAHALARDKDFFTGNLFTSNYHFLYARHIINDVDKQSFAIDQQLFMNNKKAFKDVVTVLRDTLLERYYNHLYPETKIAKAFNYRGVSGAEYEIVYFQHLLEYLVKYLKKNKHYYLAAEIIRRYDLTSVTNISLSDLRDQVDEIYRSLPEDSEEASEFFGLRNIVHNAMTFSVIRLFRDFNNSYETEAKSQIEELMIQIRDYYRTSSSQLLNMARQSVIKDVVHTELIQALEALPRGKIKLEKLLSLSTELTRLRQSFLASDNTRSLKVMRFILRVRRYISRNLDWVWFNKRAKNQAIIMRQQVLLNLAYTEGILKTKQWQKATKDITDFNRNVTGRNNEKLLKSVDAISSAIFQAGNNVQTVYGKSFKRWKSVAPSIEGIIDDTIKSGSLIKLAEINKILKNSIAGKSKTTIMWSGESYGYLSYISKNDMLTKSAKYTALNEHSIPVFETLPLDLSVVSAVITKESQTDLDHINLKSKQRNTPNLVYPDIMRSKYAWMVKKKRLVHMLLENGKVSIKTARLKEAEKFWKKVKPKPIGRLPDVNLSSKKLLSTRQLGYEDVNLVGAKAANYAELAKVLNPLMGYDMVRPGFAIPFAYYHDFLQQHADSLNLRQQLKNLKQVKDSNTKEKTLEQLRDKILSLPVDKKLIDSVRTRLNNVYPEQKIRFRSSTNSEDLQNFSGAGLYTSSSYTPSKKKKNIARAIKTVWASIWNRRAYDEREYYGIDHSSVYAAILLNPSFSDEEGNGVAISRNTTTYNHKNKLPAVYLNSQLGEYSISNPTPGIKGEELLVYYNETAPIVRDTDYTELQFLSYSSQTSVNPDTGERNPVFKHSEYASIVSAVRAAHRHFKKLLDPQNKQTIFALDMEYKVDDLETKSRKVYFKQARPYVTGNAEETCNLWLQAHRDCITSLENKAGYLETFHKVFKDISFQTSSSKLSAQARSILDIIAKALKIYPKTVPVEIGGQASHTGEEDFNLKLSQSRAASVRDYLISKGVSADTLSTNHFGWHKPKYTSASSKH